MQNILRIKNYQQTLNENALPLLVYGLCFSLFLGTAVFTILIELFAITWLLAGNYRIKIQRIVNHAIIFPVLLFFTVISVGLSYAEAEWASKFPIYLKYHKLLYIPLILTVIKIEQRKALNAFLIASIIILLLSYLSYLGILPMFDPEQGYVVTRNRIAHNVFMAFACFMMLHKAITHQGIYRKIWFALSILAIINIVFMVNGRTGQVILIGLLPLFFFQVWKKKAIIPLLFAGLLGGTIVLTFFPLFENSRMGRITQEMKNPNESAGIRLNFYLNSIKIIQERPIIGVGTGGFEKAYHQLTLQNKIKNPHNQFLLTTAELGIIGLSSFLFFLWSIGRISYRFSSQSRHLTQGLLLTFVIGSLFNSFLMDAGEGRFFCVLLAVLLLQLNPRNHRP